MTLLAICILAACLLPFFAADSGDGPALPSSDTGGNAPPQPSHLESLVDSTLAERDGGNAPPPAAANADGHDAPPPPNQSGDWISEIPANITQQLAALGYELTPDKAAWLANLPPETRMQALQSFQTHLRDWYAQNYTPHAQQLARKMHEQRQQHAALQQLLESTHGRLARQLADNPQLLARVSAYLRGDETPDDDGPPQRAAHRGDDDPALQRIAQLEQFLAQRDEQDALHTFQSVKAAHQQTVESVIGEIGQGLGFDPRAYPTECDRALRIATGEIQHLRTTAENVGRHFKPNPGQLREIMLDAFEAAGFVNIYESQQRARATTPTPPSGQARPAASAHSLDAIVSETLAEAGYGVS